MLTHDNSIPRANTTYIGKTDEAPRFSTSTRYVLSTCEAMQDGVRCQVQTTDYFTTTEGEERYICDEHFRDLLRLIRLHYYTRKIFRGGRVA